MKKSNFTIIENEILGNVDMFSKNEVLAYMTLKYFANQEGECFPSYTLIARYMRTSRKVAVDAIQELVKKGVIKIENRKASNYTNELQSNKYSIVDVTEWLKAAKDNIEYITTKNKKHKRIEEKKADKKVSKKTTKKQSIKSRSKKQVVNESEECLQAKLLREADIKFVPYKKDKEVIESLEVAIVEEAIRVTKSRASVPNWNYFLTTYDNLCVKNNQNTECTPEQVIENTTNNLIENIGYINQNIEEKDLYFLNKKNENPSFINVKDTELFTKEIEETEEVEDEIVWQFA